LFAGISAPELLVIFVVTFLGGLVQGSIGYGLALVASPVLLLIDPYLIPGPMAITAFILVLLIALRDRVALDISDLKWALAGLIGGTLIGTYILARFTVERFSLLFGILILVAVIISAGGFRFRRTVSTLLGAGLLAGVMGIVTTTSGPPIAILYQDAPGKQLRATISTLFIFGTIIAMGSLATIGRFGGRELRLSLTLIPGVILGYLLSSRLTRWVDRGFTRPAVLVIATLSALAIIVGQFI
jgi:hypothetical protein